jgi:hypothetical protein
MQMRIPTPVVEHANNMLEIELTARQVLEIELTTNDSISGYSLTSVIYIYIYNHGYSPFEEVIIRSRIQTRIPARGHVDNVLEIELTTRQVLK